MENDVKDLVGASDLYKKHYSFHDLSLDEKQFEKILLTLSKKEVEVEHLDSDYKKSILKRVFADLKKDEPENSAVFKLRPNVMGDLSTLEEKDYLRYLFYRYRYEVFPVTKEIDDYPPCIQIEPTSICNFRCVFCYQTDQSFSEGQSEHMGNMSIELFMKLIDEAEGKCEAVTLASRGEPLINKDFSKMLKYMDGKFLATKVNTNASLLTEKRCHQILETNLHTLVFSADAAEKDLYAKLRVNGDLAKVLKNVKMFSEIKEKHYSSSKLITRVSGVKVNSEQSLDQMEDFWGSMVDQVAFVQYNPWENTYERPVNDVTAPCSDLWRRLFVWFDGKVNPCDVDYKSDLLVGNAKEKTISELWKSPGYKGYRESHLNKERKKLSPCDKCTFI